MASDSITMNVEIANIDELTKKANKLIDLLDQSKKLIREINEGFPLDSEFSRN